MYGAFRGSESGLTEAALRHRVARGELTRLFPGVYASVLDARRPECQWEAALLSVPGEAFLFGTTAAALHKFRPESNAVVHVAVPDRRDLRRLPNRVLHRPCVLSASDLTLRRGLPVTTVERTLVDLAARSTEEETVHLVAAVLQNRFSTANRIQQTAQCARHAHGAGRLLRVVDELVPTRNWFEVSVIRGLVRAGLPRPETGVVIQTPDGPRYPDGYYPKERVAIEADGAAAHFGLDEWGAGLERDDALAAVGVETVHITYRQWHRNERRCIQRVAWVLAARSACA